jgi:hypothetical protein
VFPALADACTADPQGTWEPFAHPLAATAGPGITAAVSVVARGVG